MTAPLTPAELAAMRARAESAAALFKRDDYDHTRLIHLFPALTGDIRALLARVAELEREIAQGRQLEYMFPESEAE